MNDVVDDGGWLWWCRHNDDEGNVDDNDDDYDNCRGRNAEYDEDMYSGLGSDAEIEIVIVLELGPLSTKYRQNRTNLGQ